MFYNTLSKGTYIKGKSFSYEIISVLGQGTFGITYKAKMFFQTKNEDGIMVDGEMNVALKEYFIKNFNGREGSSVTNTDRSTPTFLKYKRTFEHESENLRFMIHPHIVRVFDFFEGNGTAYYSMELFEGGSLDQKIDSKGRLPEDEAIRHIREIGAALSYMHDYKMLHLDLKPGNVMINDEGEAVLIDFGLSKQYGDDGIALDSEELGKGTPGYAPLEQSKGINSVEFLATLDVYALAATLFKMLTGQRPPLSEKIKDNGFPAFLLQEYNISDEVIYMVAKGMQPDSENRPKSVDEFLSLCKPKCDEDASMKLRIKADETSDKTHALQLYKKAFELDPTSGMLAYDIATIYYQNEDDVNAAKWYLIAGKLGFVLNDLGEIYEQGCGVPKNMRLAIKWWRESCKDGDYRALSHMGDLYFEGNGVPQDYSEAFRFYKKSIETCQTKHSGDCNKEYYCLGYMYEYGLGTEKNIHTAMNFYLRVANKYEFSKPSTLSDFVHRISDSMFRLGCIYLFDNEIKTDYSLAMKWFLKASQYDMPAAQYNIGCMYSNGQGVTVDNEIAFQWYMKSAQQGYYQAEYNVGVSYQYGLGCVKDYDQAEVWLSKAIEHQHPSAQQALDNLKLEKVKSASQKSSIFHTISNFFKMR